MKECIICGQPAERHHIVYKSQGGLDIPLNYVFLCHYHHRSKDGPHKNREIDLKYKTMLQHRLMSLLTENFYDMKIIMGILKVNPMQEKVFSKKLNRYKRGYKKMDIIKGVMGGKLY